jgi:hypothetical protein
MPKVVAVTVALLVALSSPHVGGHSGERATAPDPPVYYADAHWGDGTPPGLGLPLPGTIPPPGP